jgi:hypothetical protein
MKIIILIFLNLTLIFSLKAQKIIKVKKEDNRFLFFQMGSQTDLLIKDKSDVFYIKLPDSLKHQLQIMVENAQFRKTTNDTLFKLIPIKGMKYSHTLIDTSFQTLLEGTCTPSQTIKIEVINTKTKKALLQNKFLAK